MAKKKAFPLRLPEDLYKDIKRLADADFRSVNAQMVMLLREASRRRLGRPPDELASNEADAGTDDNAAEQE